MEEYQQHLTEKSAWERFKQTGSVDSYLDYCAVRNGNMYGKSR